MVVIAALGLGCIHGGVGVFHQLVAILAVDRVIADTDAGGYMDFVFREEKRFFEDGQQLASHHGGILIAAEILDQQDELIAAQPCQRVAGANRLT